jgi:hypothetical protein
MAHSLVYVKVEYQSRRERAAIFGILLDVVVEAVGLRGDTHDVSFNGGRIARHDHGKAEGNTGEESTDAEELNHFR